MAEILWNACQQGGVFEELEGLVDFVGYHHPVRLHHWSDLVAEAVEAGNGR